MREPDPYEAPREGDAPMGITLARLEAKIDVVLARLDARVDRHSDEIEDHEDRIRQLERQPHIKPSTLWTAIVGGVSAFVALSPFIQHLTAML